MSEKYLLLITILEFVTAVLATVLFKKYTDSREKYFLYFLWFTVFVEIGGALMRYVFSVENFWLYNFYMVISFLFYFYWYYLILKQKNVQRTVLVFSVVFTGVALWNLVFQSWAEYHQYTFVVGALFTLIVTVFHFWQLLYSNQILVIQYKLSFWISSGLLLFYIGMVPLMLLSRYFKLTGSSYYILIISLNGILYGCYIIGFLWTKEKYNRF
ncbi:MAG: hypothetical protein QM485_07175 [Flavobacteriaceae bacterium]